MDSAENFWDHVAMLGWQVELGVDEATLDAPVNRYEIPAAAPKVETQPVELPKAKATPPPAAAAPDPVELANEAVNAARLAAQNATSIETLTETVNAFEHCELKRGARSTLLGVGAASAPVMIIGEPPNRDEDREGRAFVGAAGQLLDRMLAAIGRDRNATDPETGVFVASVMPWRPPNRDPNATELAMTMPFLERLVELVDPKIVILMGNVSCQAALGRNGITRLRGQWLTGFNRPVLPMFNPEFLLRTPAAKREAWHDLLMVKAKLNER